MNLLKFTRFIPTVVSRARASQSSLPPTPGSGVPISGSTKTVEQTGGTKPGDSSVLPKSTTKSDHTNPIKTSSDAPPLDHEHVDIENKKRSTRSSSSSSEPKPTPGIRGGKLVALVLLTAGIYAGFKMVGGNSSPKKSSESEKKDHYRRATADHQPDNAKGTDVKA